MIVTELDHIPPELVNPNSENDVKLAEQTKLTFVVRRDDGDDEQEGSLLCAIGIVPLNLIAKQAYIWMHFYPGLMKSEVRWLRHNMRILLDRWPNLCSYIRDCDPEISHRFARFMGFRRLPDSDCYVRVE